MKRVTARSQNSVRSAIALAYRGRDAFAVPYRLRELHAHMRAKTWSMVCSVPAVDVVGASSWRLL